MIGMRPRVYQFGNGQSPSLIISSIRCLSVLFLINWLGDLLVNFLSVGSGQSGSGQGEKKDLPPKTKTKGGRKTGIAKGK
jgi:hypothetical protein